MKDRVESLKKTTTKQKKTQTQNSLIINLWSVNSEDKMVSLHKCGVHGGRTFFSVELLSPEQSQCCCSL